MDILLLALVLCVISGARFTGKELHEGYLSKTQTTNINGVLVALIFIRHFLGSLPDTPLSFLSHRVGQFVVAPILFYSGYGVMTSIVRKGAGYVAGLPYYRVFRIWTHFALAVVLFLARNVILGEPYTWKQYLVALTAWDAVGNSCWYIFTILILYIATFLTYCLASRLAGRVKLRGRALSVNELTVVLMFAACLLYMATLLLLDQKKEYFNTSFYYPLGMLTCLCKPSLDKWLREDGRRYRRLLLGTVGIFLAASLLVLALWLTVRLSKESLNIVVMGIPSMALIVLLSMKISVNSGVLAFLGSYVFEIYMLQRIPLKFCEYYFMEQPVVAAAVSITVTFLLALLFHRFTNDLDDRMGMKRSRSLAK